MSDASQLLEEALALPAESRAALIDSLLASLDNEADDDAPEAWREEIRRRFDEIDSGAVQLVAWEDVRRRLRSRLNR